MADESQTPSPSQPSDSTDAATPRNWTDITIPVMMTAIIIMLAVLWFMERRQRIDVNDRFNAYINQQEKEKTKMSGLFANLMKSAPEVTTRVAEAITSSSIDKKNLPTEKVVVGQKETTAWRVNKADGEKLGLTPGDVIIVGQ